MPSAFAGLGVSGRRRSRRSTNFTLALPVPVYRLRVQAVFGHLLEVGGSEPAFEDMDALEGDAAPLDHGR